MMVTYPGFLPVSLVRRMTLLSVGRKVLRTTIAPPLETTRTLPDYAAVVVIINITIIVRFGSHEVL